MIPQIPFDEVGLILTTMTSGVQFLYFILIVGLSSLGLYIQDKEIDKIQSNKKGYEYEWNELVPYAIVSAIFTMAIFEMYAISFWYSMILAVLMGMTFRTTLPELVKIFAEKIKAIMNTIFGRI